LVRLETFLHESEDPLAGELLDFILDALQVLTHQPGIGRPVEGGLRELIISRRRSGYLARYAWDDALDRVMVARIRHQRDALQIRAQQRKQWGSSRRAAARGNIHRRITAGVIFQFKLPGAAHQFRKVVQPLFVSNPVVHQPSLIVSPLP
jgi:plasmid stabilization system protein ParE